jgi:hypothetical protein
MLEPERIDGQWHAVQRFTDGQPNTKPLPKVLSESEAREMLHSWDGNDAMRPPAGPAWWWFAARWGQRYAVWKLGQDGKFHLTYDGPWDSRPE